MCAYFYAGFGTNNPGNMCQVVSTIYQVVVKGYHECPFAVEVGERFVAQKKKGDQLGHLQRDLVAFKKRKFGNNFFHSSINCLRNFFGKNCSLGVDTYPAILTTVI